MSHNSERPEAENGTSQTHDDEKTRADAHRAAILEAIALSAAGLIKTADLEQKIEDLLTRLGECAEADRVYVFENRTDYAGNLITIQRYRWAAPDLESFVGQAEIWDFLLLDVGLERWIETLGSDQVLHGPVRDFPPNECQMLSARDIQSILIAPIFVRGIWWGFLGFDNCRTAVAWPHSEIDAIKLAAGIIGAALENLQLHQDTEVQAQQLSALRDINRTLGGTLAQDTLLRLTLEHICRQFDVPRAAAYLANPKEGVAEQHAAVAIPEVEIQESPPLALKTSLTGQVVITGRPVFIEQAAQTVSGHGDERGGRALSENVQSELPTSVDDAGGTFFTAKAAAFIPLAVGEHVLGTVNMAFDRPRRFTDDEKRLLTTIGRQAGIALANARLYQDTVTAERETRRRANQLAALHEIDRAINSSLEPAAVYACIVEQAVGLLNCQSANLLLWDQATNEAIGVAGFSTYGSDDDGNDLRLTATEHPVIQEMQSLHVPVAISDVEADDRIPADWHIKRAARALLAIPLISRDQITGFLLLFDQTGPRQWRRDEITLAGQLADQAAIAIANAVLFAAEQKSRQTAEALRETARIVNASLDLDQTLRLLLEQLAKLVAYDSAAVFLREQQTLHAAAGRGFPDPDAVLELSVDFRDNALLNQIIETRRPMVLNNAQQDERFLGWGKTQYVCGWIGVPLMVGPELVGVLTIDSRQPGAYDDESARLAQALADHTAVAVHKTRLLEDLKRVNRELRELDELKGQFIQNVAHELRTPLTLVRGYIELLAQGSLNPETQNHAINKAMSYTHALVHLVEAITTLQDLSIGELAPEPVDPTELVETVLLLAKQKAMRAGIALQVACPKKLSPFSGDFIWLSQALYQLVDNAIKFSPDGGTVTLHVNQIPQRHELQIAVEDEGIGVPSSEQERVFDLFYQADGTTTRRFGGTGLGLAIVQRVVRAHGGRVWLESPVRSASGEQNPGSRFVIGLPWTAS